jgi:hypothetical protein
MAGLVDLLRQIQNPLPDCLLPFGKHIVHKAIQYPIARLRHEEFGYHPSGKQEFGPRLKYALVGTVITHKTTTGQSTVAVGQIAGAVGSGLISRLWQPASVSSVASGFASGGITLGVDAGLKTLPRSSGPISDTRTDILRLPGKSRRPMGN